MLPRTAGKRVPSDGDSRQGTPPGAARSAARQSGGHWPTCPATLRTTWRSRRRRRSRRWCGCCGERCSESASAGGGDTGQPGCQRCDQVAIAQAPAIPALVRLLDSDVVEVQRKAASALANLSGNAANQVAIAQAQAIPALVPLLESDAVEVQWKAASALANLSGNAATRWRSRRRRRSGSRRWCGCWRAM